MENYEDIFQEYSKAETAEDRAEIMENLPAAVLETDPRAGQLYNLWRARYYYVDKKKSRVGDRFVWVYLAASSLNGKGVARKELLRVYNEAMLSQQTKQAAQDMPKELQQHLYEAAAIYVSTLKEPPKILGIIPSQDKTNKAKLERIAADIVASHLYDFWKECKDLNHFNIVATQLVRAAADGYPGIENAMDTQVEEIGDDGFTLWANEIKKDI